MYQSQIDLLRPMCGALVFRRKRNVVTVTKATARSSGEKPSWLMTSSPGKATAKVVKKVRAEVVKVKKAKAIGLQPSPRRQWGSRPDKVKADLERLFQLVSEELPRQRAVERLGGRPHKRQPWRPGDPKP
jgi:hypothetical protein